MTPLPLHIIGFFLVPALALGDILPLPQRQCHNSVSSSDACDTAETLPISIGKRHYCPGDEKINEGYSILSSLRCFNDTSPSDAVGDFVQPDLQPGQVTPIIWRNTSKVAQQNGYQVGLPPQLITSLLRFGDELGVIDLFRKFTSDAPIPPKDTHNGKFIELEDGKNFTWYAQGLQNKWQSNAHWVSPGNEITHEKFLRVLADGGFDIVLDGIGRALELNSLTVYQISFLGVNHGLVSTRHVDSSNTGNKAMGLIIPLLIEDDVPPELTIWDDRTNDRGGLKYHQFVGTIQGDNANHGTAECDYRELTNAKHGGYLQNQDGKSSRRIGMRLTAIVYIADIDEENVAQITDSSVSQVFPLWHRSTDMWLMAQQGRHWQAQNNSVVGSNGREHFDIIDERDDCAVRAKKGMCETDIKETRKKCLASCNVYMESY